MNIIAIFFATLIVVSIFTTFIMPVMATDTVAWDRTFGGFWWDGAQSVQQTTDGGFIIVGVTNSFGAGDRDVWLIKTDVSGNEEWNRTFGKSGREGAFSVQQTTDGGFIMAGRTDSIGAGYRDMWLIKTDAAGNKEWDRAFGGSDWDGAQSVQQTEDGGFIIAGTTQSFGAGKSDFWLIKTDAAGNKEWNRTFGGSDWDSAWSVQQTADNGFIIAGVTDSFGAGYRDMWLIKTDAAGNKEWDRTFGGLGDDWAFSVQQTKNSGFIIAGETDSFRMGNIDDVWLVKTDAFGNEEWNRTFGGFYLDSAQSVQQTKDGGFIIAGKTKSFGAGGSDVWIVKTDYAGNKEWNHTLGGSDRDLARSIQQTSNGGFIIAGETESFGVGADIGWLGNFWMVKVGPEGIILPELGPEPEFEIPGFGIVVTIISLLGAILLFKKKD
ncbi:MAG: PGF-CTERM sorting domain-containing protein [Methanosarcinales archaeon]|nr:PGF-CTERM sorting domain-containing protein [Methanosarcinales archaeon]